MADDDKSRPYRSNDPYRRAAEPSWPSDRPSASDPLAELARLIGQSDPFAELGRNQPRQGQQEARQEIYAAPDDWPHAPAHEPRFVSDEAPRREAHESRHGSNYPSGYGSKQDYVHPSAHDAEGRRQDGHSYQDSHADQDSQPYDEAPLAAEQQDRHYADDRMHGHVRNDDDQYDDERQDHVQHHDAQHGGVETDHFYQDDAPLGPHEDEMYDDAPRARRHGGLATALALVGCAMLGTAGAYAYRSYTGNPGSPPTPPVITADSSTPTKIVPATAGDPQSSKIIQDRLANAGREQIVSKQEEPVALKEPGTQTAPRVVLPSPVAPAQGGSAPQPGAGGSNEPRKVKTVIIRPDGNDMSGRPVGTLPPATQAPAGTRPATTPPAPRATTPSAAPTRSSGGPISLDPQTSEPAAAPPARTRSAAVSPAETSSSGSGGFVIQISSQKSEGDAQSSFRSLQAKYPNELGARQPIIRRADLGSKGVFYRTLVGPFASAQEASQFCASYKAAGGQCQPPMPNN